MSVALTKNDPPHSRSMRRSTRYQKATYDQAMAVITTMGDGRSYADQQLDMRTDAFREVLHIRLVAMDLTVANYQAWGGMVERYRPGQWVTRVADLYETARLLRLEHEAQATDFDATRFQPVDDAEVWQQMEADTRAFSAVLRRRAGLSVEPARAQRADDVASTYRIDQVTPGIYYVQHPLEDERAYMVDVAAGTCECPDWQCRGRQSEFYCKHMLALGAEIAEPVPAVLRRDK